MTRIISLLVILLAIFYCCTSPAVAAPAQPVDTKADAAQPLAAQLQVLVDRNVIAGAVFLVADKEKVLEIGSVGYSSLSTKRAMQNGDLFWIASMTKPVTATAFMMLVDEGKVKIDDPVEKYLPEFKGQMVAEGQSPPHVPRHPITIKEILTHTSGLIEPGDRKDKRTFILKDDIAAYAAAPLKREPGTKYEYNNAGIDTAGRIIEVVSGMSYAQFMQGRLFDPLEMKETTYWPTEAQAARLAHSARFNADKTALEEVRLDKGLTPAIIERVSYGVPVPPPMVLDFGIGICNDYANHFALPAGGLFSTADDLAKFCQMLLSGGTWHGKRYLSEAAVHEMTRIQTGDIPVNPQEGYGLGWSVKKATAEGPSIDSFGHRGARRPVMWVDPKNGLVMILLVERFDMPGDGQKALYTTFLTGAIAKYGKGK